MRLNFNTATWQLPLGSRHLGHGTAGQDTLRSFGLGPDFPGARGKITNNARVQRVLANIKPCPARARSGSRRLARVSRQSQSRRTSPASASRLLTGFTIREPRTETETQPANSPQCPAAQPVPCRDHGASYREDGRY